MSCLCLWLMVHLKFCPPKSSSLPWLRLNKSLRLTRSNVLQKRFWIKKVRNFTKQRHLFQDNPINDRFSWCLPDGICWLGATITTNKSRGITPCQSHWLRVVSRNAHKTNSYLGLFNVFHKAYIILFIYLILFLRPLVRLLFASSEKFLNASALVM